MSRFDDDDSEMRCNPALDEREIETLLRGLVPPERPDLEPVARFVATARAEVADSPLPVPSRELASLLATGLTASSRPVPSPRRDVTGPARRAPVSKWRRNMIVQAFASAIARASGLGVAAKLAAVTTVVTVAGVSSAAATGALPAPIQSVVADSVDTVTPFNIPRPSDPHAPGSNGIGEQVREQARHHGRDKHQGDTGTDKQSHPTGKPTAPGAKGLQQANSGPAAPHAPDAVPGGKPSSHPGKGDPCAKSTHSPGGPPTSVPGNRPTAAGPGGNGSHSDCPPTQAPGSR